jgi:hypothetical protein
MADHGEVKLRDVKIQSLIDTYHRAYKNIVETIASDTEAGKIQKARTMATIRAQLQDLGDNVGQWVAKEIPQYYLDGANIALQDLRDIGADLSGPKGLVAINKDAIAVLVDETRNAFAESITAVSRNAQNFVSDALKQQLRAVLADGTLTGEARKTIAKNVVAAMEDAGLGALIDARGVQWPFERYADMLVRTKAVEARNAGLQDKMLQNGYDLVQVSDHGATDVCADWEGEILSISGNTPGYKTTEEAEADGLMHPNCRHAYNVINNELAAKTEAYDNPYNHLSEADRAAADQAFRDRNSAVTTP